MKKLLLPLLLLCLLCTACGPASSGWEEPVSDTVFAMDTVMDLKLWGPEEVLREARELIPELESRLSVTDPDSEIARVNREGTGELSPVTRALVARALELCRDTEGALDISVYPVVRAWGFTTGDFRVPEPEELEALLARVDYARVRLEGNCLRLDESMEIDLGSVAKGYTGDLLVELFRQRGLTSALLNLGGNVQALGARPDGTPWRVGIQDPLSPDYLGILEIRDEAVVTSGGYERYFEDAQGNVYWHIMDPRTGAPARQGLISATAVGPEGVRCDALSTALFVMGEERAVEYWQTHGDFQMILVTEEGEVLVTPGLENRFRLTQAAPYRLRVVGHA